MSSWKRDAASGLVVLVPILVTLYIVYWLYVRIAGLPILQDVIPSAGLRVLVTLVVFALVVLAVGYLMRTAVGSLVEAYLDHVINRLPGLRVVYNASKMAVDTALGGTSELQAPVKVTVWGDFRMTAFKTGKSTDDGRELIFLPTAPNITTGYVLEARPGDFEEVDESVEDALTRILSAGFGENESVSAERSLVGAIEEEIEGEPDDGSTDGETDE